MDEPKESSPATAARQAQQRSALRHQGHREISREREGASAGKSWGAQVIELAIAIGVLLVVQWRRRQRDRARIRFYCGEL